MAKKLPIGIQSFEKIRTDNFYYVDKTRFVHQLFESGTYFFLSRPRRFGKSLFINALKQAFLGKKALFTGLYLEKNWDWNIAYPVIYISFGLGVHRNLEELQVSIEERLQDNQNAYIFEFKVVELDATGKVFSRSKRDATGKNIPRTQRKYISLALSVAAKAGILLDSSGRKLCKNTACIVMHGCTRCFVGMRFSGSR